MKSTVTTIGKTPLLVAGFIAVCGLAVAETQPALSKTRLQTLQREANTPEQYQTLANYYRSQEQSFRAQADEENQELERYLAHPAAAPKFPTRGDTARGLRDYYAWKANDMAAKAVKYEAQLQQSADRMQTASAATAPAPSLTPTEAMLLQKIEQLEKQVKEIRQ